MVLSVVRHFFWFLVLVCGSVAALQRAPLLATPDQASFQRATESLSDGRADDAFRQFVESARYGNKQAQKSIALMYIKGAGVPKDWARAYAWFRLAGSHGNAAILQAGDEVWDALKEDEKAHSSRVYQELLPRYGDVAALALRKQWVQEQKRRLAGRAPLSSLRVQLADSTGYSWELSGQEYFEVLDGYLRHFGRDNLAEDMPEVLE